MNTSAQNIPTRLNILIFCLTLPATWGLLWMASHLPLGWMLLAAWLFALINNTAFSLMHEAVHGVFSANRRINEIFGTLCAPTLPTSFTVQRIAHAGHHRRNRTDRELFDYYLPGQSKRGRDLILYGGNLLGLYWFFIPLNALIYLCLPWLFRSRRFIEGPARWLSFEPFVRDIVASRQSSRIWLECLWALLYHVALFWLLGLNWQGWLLCYWAFALHWSSLQYVDHAWSVRDVVNGAWNLKVLRLSRLLALNYHCHLAHHQHPQAPWTELPRLVDPARPQPTFWAIYFSLWRHGTRPAPPMGQEPSPPAA
ncbi:MAG: fatty acid desaturase [Azonexus sp.]|jgi:fatty acid desaturase|nr:fatty acid desaturase [Azonexus sp.]